MKTVVNERGQVVIPKIIRYSVHIGKGDELEIKALGETIVLKPIRRFKAKKWQDYAGIGEGIVDAYLGDKKEENSAKKRDPLFKLIGAGSGDGSPVAMEHDQHLYARKR